MFLREAAQLVGAGAESQAAVAVNGCNAAQRNTRLRAQLLNRACHVDGNIWRSPEVHCRDDEAILQ